jgi:hypothetical protein
LAPVGLKYFPVRQEFPVVCVIKTHPCPISVSYPLLSLIVFNFWIFEAKVSEERVGQQLFAGQPFGRLFIYTFLQRKFDVRLVLSKKSYRQISCAKKLRKNYQNVVLKVTQYCTTSYRDFYP